MLILKYRGFLAGLIIGETNHGQTDEDRRNT